MIPNCMPLKRNFILLVQSVFVIKTLLSMVALLTRLEEFLPKAVKTVRTKLFTEYTIYGRRPN